MPRYLASTGDYLIGHPNDFRHEFDRECSEQASLHLLMVKNLLLTGRVKAIQSGERLRRDLARGLAFAGNAHLLPHAIAASA